MNVTEINSVYGWYNDKLTVTEYKTEHYPEGNDTHTVERRIYSVSLYNAQGVLEHSHSKGSNVDIKS